MKYLYAANWKMNMGYSKSLDFCTTHAQKLHALADIATIVLCPTFIALAPIVNMFQNSAVFVGAQNCSEHEKGAYTGEISAASLAEIGITYCIVGHSERRMYYGETTDAIVKKIDLLSQNNITPIICVGESHQEFRNKATFTVLTEQLKPIIAHVKQKKELIIAYEPIWSIGTGIIPENTYLQEVFAWMRKLLHSQLTTHAIKLLYGGSVDSKNSKQLKTIANIDGFLIGGASTNFDEFVKIIQLS